MDFSAIKIVVDPDLDANTVLLQSGSEQGILVAMDFARLAQNPLIAEDCTSLMESAPFFIRFRESGEPIRCECCGTPVVAVPEASVDDPPPRRWVRAIWEAKAGRKHTLRRCNWKRDRAASVTR
jgi:hypothetical protein